MSGESTTISVQCNDPSNGDEQGLAGGLVIFGLELEPNNAACAYKFAVEGSTIRLHGANYVIEDRTTWFGNFAWDGFHMPSSEAWRLLKSVKQSGKWSASGGPSDLFNWYNEPEK